MKMTLGVMIMRTEQLCDSLSLINTSFTPHSVFSQRQKTTNEEHKSYYAISTTYVYGQEKYLLVSTDKADTLLQ